MADRALRGGSGPRRPQRPPRPGRDSGREDGARRGPGDRRRTSEPVGRRRDGGSGGGLRREAGEWLYGRNAVRESLRARRRGFRRLLVASGAGRGGAVGGILERCAELRVQIEEAERERLDDVTGGANHQGVCLLASPYPYDSLDELLRRTGEPLYLVLDSLQDPQNLGTVLRTAEGVGATGVIIPEHRAAQVTPTVVNASAGAVEHLRIAQVVNLARALGELKEAGVWVVGLEAVPGAASLWDVRLDGPLALVVGSEGEGIRRLVLEACDVVARLPLLGRVESLNASVAAAIALYEALRRRGS